MPEFHMPIGRGDFFAPHTTEVIAAFLEAGHTFEGYRIIALVTDYRISQEDRENVTPDARLTLLGEDDDGKISYCDPRQFQDPVLRQAFAEVAAAWTTDDLASQSVAYGTLPTSQSSIFADAALGKLYRHIQARNFALFGREYPATAAEDFGDSIQGPDAELEGRRYYMNLLLPPVSTAHQKIEEATTHSSVEDLARRIYDFEMDSQTEILPLAPFDFSEAFNID